EHGAIIANIGQGKNYIYWQGNPGKNRKLPVPHFSKFREIWDMEVQNILLEHNERILCLFFENGFLLKIYLFPPYNNVVLMKKIKEIKKSDNQNTVLETHYEKKEDKFSDAYEKEFSGVSIPNFCIDFKLNKDRSLIDYCEQTMPALLQTKIRTELENRINSNLDIGIEKLTSEQTEAFQNFINELNSSIAILIKVEKPYFKFKDFLPFIPSFVEDDSQPEYFDDINRAAQFFINTGRKVKEFEDLQNKAAVVLKAKLKYLNNTLKQLKTQLRQADKREKYIKQANLILWNLHEIKKGDTEKELTDYDSSNLDKIKVKFDIRLEPKEYAEKLFSKAKRLEDLSQVNYRIKKTEKSYNTYSAFTEELEDITEIKPLKSFIKKLNESGIDINEKQKLKNILSQRKSFREYIYKNHAFKVGKSAHESDELTFKIAKKTDWFFHAQGITGSHVVVSHVEGKKLEYLSPDIINIAGIIAAYYSNAKNSSYVPVQYAQIRYLRKSKGAAAGLVIFNQYKSIFAEPLKFQKLNFE
ncbi:MAG: DUF814 domain-containing protein, partial [Calditrichia bacterium]|nr:DUF814 domain-containing protein [Calditrichia bacterium]